MEPTTQPKRYRKKPVEIEAIHYDSPDKTVDILEWINFNKGEAYLTDQVTFGSKIAIQTLEGIMYASFMDYIIRGVNGEFYPCKPDIFEKSYDDA